MEKIKDFLLNNGYTFYEDGILDGCNNWLKIAVVKGEDYYLLRIAILCYFDRWANSGFDFKFKTEEDLINYLKSPNCIADAMKEMIFDIVEDCKWNKDYSNLDKVIDLLYDMVMEENN